jgi:sugar lactone lactonase YvrE
MDTSSLRPRSLPTLLSILSLPLLATLRAPAYGQSTEIATVTTLASVNAQSIAVDLSGNVYVAEQLNSIICKVTPAGVVTTLAGSGSHGWTDGTGTGAAFLYPEGVAVDPSGNVYVADESMIRKISPAGVVTTLAGNGSSGSTDGTGTAASFNDPYGVAVDTAGNVYVADTGNYEIRKISPAGVVTTVAGNAFGFSRDGTGTAASFNDPYGVAVDPLDNVYVVQGDGMIRKITSAGVVTTLAGWGNTSWLYGVAVDAAGNIYVADYGGNKIRKVSPAGVVTIVAGSGNSGSSDGIGAAASFDSPFGVAVDASGSLYVADYSEKIRKIVFTMVPDSAPSFSNQPVNQTQPVGGDAYFSASGTTGIPVPTLQWQISRDNGVTWSDLSSGSLYAGVTSDTLAITGMPLTLSGSKYRCAATNQVDTAFSQAATLMLYPAAIVTTFAGTGYTGSADGTGTGASFAFPYGVAVDAAGYVYVADTYNNEIRKVSPAGIVTTLAGRTIGGSADGTGTAASFGRPPGVAVDAAGRVYVADSDNNKIRKISPAGVVTTLAGSGAAGSKDGMGTAASFNAPSAVAVDASGNVYVADSYNDKIRKISPAGAVTTLAGSGSEGAVDGMGTAASFKGPNGVTVDASGNIYVADANNDRIRKIGPGGAVTTLAGSGSQGAIDGTGTAARFYFPSGVAMDASGNVYVADCFNSRIRKISPTGAVTTPAGVNSIDPNAGFSNPSSLAVDAAGNVYVADPAVNKVRKITMPLPQPRAAVMTWPAPASIAVGTALSSVQLDATADVPGTFTYSSEVGTVLPVGTQTLSATFTPIDSVNFTGAIATQELTVIQANPADLVFLQQIFPAVLGRQIDSGALAAYLAAMANGRSRSQVFGDLVASGEYAARQLEPAIRLYLAALARCPDYLGLQNWTSALQADALTLTGAADQFATSAEFVQKYGSLDNTAYVQQLYRNVLGREADPSGLADWVGQLNKGASRGTILVGFSESPEFQADMANQVDIIRLYYLLMERMPSTAELQNWIAFLNGDDQTDTLFTLAYPSGLSGSAYVQAMFQGFLCRAADSGALSTFTNGLAAGTVTHGSLVDSVLNSAEFSLYVGPVSRLYLAAFNRVPDQPGLINWVNYAEAGNSLASVADTFTASQEFTNRYGAMGDTAYVTALYQNVLGRAPDPAGLTYWAGLLARGTSRGGVLIGFSQSPEGINLFAPTLRTFLSYYAFLNTAPAQSDLTFWNNYFTTLDDQMREALLADMTANNGN